MKVLITGGGTIVPIDRVRYIGNRSTGKTAATLADFFAKDCDVRYLKSKTAVSSHYAEVLEYETFDELKALLEQSLEDYRPDLVIHAAAVSDYKIQEEFGEKKLPSGQNIALTLTPTPKLITLIKNNISNLTLLVGFKLTVGASKEEVKTAVDRVLANGADLVVHNDLVDLSEMAHPFSFWGTEGIQSSGNNKEEMSLALLEAYKAWRKK